MSVYKIGSTGEEVKRLQDALRVAGFDPGASDGIYGSRTAAAVTAYQKANNLTPDGIAGQQTLGSLSAPKLPTTVPTSKVDPDAADKAKAREIAGITNLSGLNNLNTTPITYKSPFEDRITSALDKILGYNPGPIDPTSSPLYAPLKQQYDSAGTSAFNNQIGRLSSLTGGRPSTAAVGTASAAQNKYAQEFSGTVLPSLINAEESRRQNEYGNIVNQLKLLQGLDETSYGRNRDTISDARYADETSYDRGQDAVKNTGVMTADQILATIPANSALRNISDYSAAIAKETDPWIKSQLQALRMEKINADPNLKAKYGSTMEIPTYQTMGARQMEIENQMAQKEYELDQRYKNEQIANMRADNARQAAAMSNKTDSTDLTKLGSPQQLNAYYELLNIYSGNGPQSKYASNAYGAYQNLITNKKANLDLIGQKLYDQLLKDVTGLMKNEKTYAGESASTSAYNNVLNKAIGARNNQNSYDPDRDAINIIINSNLSEEEQIQILNQLGIDLNSL